MLVLFPDSAHNEWKQVESSNRSRRTPQKNGDIRPNAPIAVSSYNWKMTRNKHLSSIKPLSPIY